MKFATVGTGWITSAFIDAAKLSGKLSLQAVYSRRKESAEQMAAKHQAPEQFTDLEQMAKSDKIDLVYIASPNALHFKQVLTFLINKKHVICEKPIFSNTEEFKEAFAAADENGVYLFEAIRNIHYPNTLLLKDKLKAAGQIRSAIFQYVQYSSRYDAFLDGKEPNVFSRKFSGGALMDLGVYPLSLAVFLFGAPKDSHYFPVLLRNGIDGAGTLVLEYADFNITVMCSKISHSFIPSEIHGEKASIVIEGISELSKMQLVDAHTKEAVLFSENQEEQNMVYEIRDFVKIMEEKDREAYQRLRQESFDVLTVLEKSRKQNGIHFRTDRS
ncbi:Gfo/Idh/MocA family protein [Heyndrickxia acidiproducens]|uniref:Gfo/Idh/MocA family protein n=1 Tax=Heyndrickxia acidiproducens TaxID=1121084 RepID=UPI00036FCA87|nr:Gfo/Idh/MocA family oxidoreductase [Heyndrickxia acidiproducens]